MKIIDKEISLFGDLYYNATREEIAALAYNMKDYPMDAIVSYLKLIMQDVLAHLAGSTSFMDACMVRDKLQFESKINNKIGKRKLTELLSLLEEFDKLGIHMDEVELPKNDNDKFLEQIILMRRKGILEEYLSISNLNDFFEMAMMIVAFMPMAREMKEFDASIPDPLDFDFKNRYYESIDYLPYYRDNDRHDSLMRKHKDVGREINLIQWINNYKNRYTIKDILREEMGIENDGYDKDTVRGEQLDETLEEKIIEFVHEEYDFREDEIDYLRLMIKDKKKEIFILKSQISGMRDSIKVVLESQDIKLTDEQFEKYEDEFVMEIVVKHITKKPRKNKPTIIFIYSAIIASLILIPTFSNISNLKHGDNLLPGKENIAIESRDDSEALEDGKDTQDEEEKVDNKEFISIVPQIEEPIIESDDETEDNTYKTEFVLGEHVSGNVPFYDSSTSNEILGFLNEEVITIGYFATVENKEGMSVLCSCRTQEQMEKFLRLYHGDGKDIIWRAAVTKVNNELVQKYLTNGEEIPYELTTCYIDCEPIRKMEKIRGK